MNSGQTRRTGKADLVVGLIIFLIVIVLLVLLMITTKGHLNRAGWTVLYLGVALVSGIAFWLATPGATGELTIKQLGLRLGGGAGIGAAFIILINWIVGPSQDYVIAKLPAHHVDDTFVIYEKEDDIEVTQLSAQRLLVEFKSDQSEAWFKAKQLSKNLCGFDSFYLEVSRTGDIKSRQMGKGEEP